MPGKSPDSSQLPAWHGNQQSREPTNQLIINSRQASSVAFAAKIQF
jgi:hypothetical protein